MLFSAAAETLLLWFIATFISMEAVSCKKSNETTIRTIGGTEVSAGKYPFIASVQLFSGKSWSPLCAGVICSDNRVITPAQCVDGYEAWQLRVLVGSHKLNETEGEQYTGKIYMVTKFVIHDYYDEETMVNDLSILHIFGHFDLDGKDTQSPIPIALTDTFPTSKCTVLGWAAKGLGVDQEQSILKETEAVIVDDDFCSDAFDTVGKTVFSDQHICAEADGACFDDEGSPLICNGELVGLVSWNLQNCGGYPVVHTRIFNYLSWLSRNGCPLCSERIKKHSIERGFKDVPDHVANELI